MTEPRRFSELDVFTAVPLLGNPLAVVHDGRGPERCADGRFARWTNLSETTFLLPPTARRRPTTSVRIFTPERELPFAGHPTLGSCHAWLGAGGQPRARGEVIQQCGVGLVRVRRDGARLAFAAPPLQAQRAARARRCWRASWAGWACSRGDVVAHQWVDNGPGWCARAAASAAAACCALKPDYAQTARPEARRRRRRIRRGQRVAQFEVRALIGRGPTATKTR